MKLYAESSAVLAWLLGEPTMGAVWSHLSSAETVFSSELTLIECDRVLIRAVVTGQISETDGADRRAALADASAHWTLLRVDADVVMRARRPFPVEPIRTLDALHLASALVARAAQPGVAVLSLDERVRKCGASLGFAVFP